MKILMGRGMWPSVIKDLEKFDSKEESDGQ